MAFRDSPFQNSNYTLARRASANDRLSDGSIREYHALDISFKCVMEYVIEYVIFWRVICMRRYRMHRGGSSLDTKGIKMERLKLRFEQ